MLASVPRAIAGLALSGCLLLAGCSIAPTPLTDGELQTFALNNLASVTADQEPVRGPISIYEAMARALKYNLDYKVEVFETMLRNTELGQAQFDMLPTAVASSDYYGRRTYSSSSSLNLITGQPNFGFSTSQEKRFTTADITFGWNILDFGLSLIRAREAADKVLIANETRRRVANRIIEDVRTAYWRAVSSERLYNKLSAIEERVRNAIENTQRMADDQQTSAITALTYQRELIEIQRTVQQLQRELLISKRQLAALMNLPPDAEFGLILPDRSPARLQLTMDISDMALTALKNRPELREVAYEKRINDQEAIGALLELLPGIQLYMGKNYDSNLFMLNNDWVSWGARAGWNLIKVINYPARQAVVQAQDDLLHQRSLAVAMAVLTQVHVSRIRFALYQRELTTAGSYLNVQRHLVEQMRAEAAADRISEQTLIREEMNLLVADVRYDIAYADLQNAFANVYSSIGIDSLTPDIGSDTGVEELARSLETLWHERGDG